MKNLKHFLVTILFLVASAISGQNYFNQLITDNLNNYRLNKYPEKIYIHTDKTFYVNNETIWFSAYLVNGITHQKSNKSLLLYTELLNEKDSLIDRKKLFIKDISTPGDFILSKNTKPGNYKIRAYTNYMRNQDVKYFFQKNITILTSNKNIADFDKTVIKADTINRNFISIEKDIKPSLNFYPQGGYMVNNLVNKVAIKLKDKLYQDLKITATIIDEKNNHISSFTSSKFGLGEFMIIPEKGKNYYAVIKKNEKTYKYKLPNSLEEGYVLNATNNNNNNKELLLQLNSNTINGFLGTSLVIHEKGKLIYNKVFKEVKKQLNLKIPNNQLNTGITHITLFNSNGKPVCERLIFVENTKQEALVSIQKPKEYFGNRKKVTLKINVQNQSNQTLPSKLSLTVKNVNTSTKNNSKNIKTWLLLNSDLRGKVENPNYFFEYKNNKRRKYLLDLLMLTHGWRKFTWQEFIKNSSEKEKFKAEKGIVISGRTLQLDAPYGIKSVPTRLTFVGNDVHQEPIKNSDATGKYSYGPFVFFDSIPVLLEARLTNFKSKNDLERNVFIAPYRKQEIAEINIDSTLILQEKYNKDLNFYIKYQKYLNKIGAKFKQYENVLNEVVIKTKLKKEKELREDEMNAATSYGSAFNRYDVSNNVGSNTLLDLLFNTPRVNVVNDSVFISRNKSISPLILYDEIPIDNADLRMIFADEVSFIDILTDGQGSMFSVDGLVISVYSKLGTGYKSNRRIKRKPGIIDYKAIGFYTAQEFYAKDHINGIEEQVNSDIRTTLHWEPNIEIKRNNNVEISFFTSDIDSKYIIEIEGITKTGIPLYKTTEIFVD